MGAGEIGHELVANKSAFKRGGAGGDRELGEISDVCAVALNHAAIVACGGNAHGGFAVAQIGRQGDGNKIAGDAIDGEAGGAGVARVAQEHGFVIACYFAACLPAFAHLPRREVLFKKGFGGGGAVRGLVGAGAGILPFGLVGEFQAAFFEGGKAVAKTLLVPLRQLVEGYGAIGGAAACGLQGGAVGYGVACGLMGDLRRVWDVGCVRALPLFAWHGGGAGG